MVWNLGFGAELIREEGDYGILTRGQTIETWVLEFYGDMWKLSEHRAKSASPIEDFRYRVVAEVLFISNGVCVLDLGIKAVGKIADPELLSQLSTGSYVSGEIAIGMTFCTEIIPENIMKSLNYRLRIEKIFEDTASIIRIESDRVIRPATEIPRFCEVEATDTDASQYVLCCSVLPTPA